ncbi:MAG: hypothetical protein ACRDJN_03560 [Chloroflexota bacterium]
MTDLTPYASLVSQELAVAAAAFRDTLAELGVSASDGGLSEPAEFGRRAALVAAADVLWRRHVGMLLDTHQVQQLLGGRTRQAVSDLVKRHRLLALPAADGRLHFPAFQFSPSGRPYPVIATVLDIFKDSALDPHTTASWFVTAKALLDGKSPAEWLRDGGDPQAVMEAARRTAGRLGH